MIDEFADLFGLVPGDETPPPPGGHPATAPGGSPRGVPEMSGTFSGDIQAGPCETSREFPAAPETSRDFPPSDETSTETPATTPSPAAGNGAPRDDRHAPGTGVAPAPSPAPKTSEKASDERSLTAAELRAYIASLDLSKLTFAQKKGLLDGLAAKERYEAENMLQTYRPYDKQNDFHAAGKTFRERLLMAGNQLGKTYSAAAETAYHLTGLYPEDWTGYVFSRPTRGLAAGVTSQLVRDSMQVLLCGYPAKALGEGMIPKRCIESEPVMARSITGAYDTVKVKHVSGGESTLYLRAYEQGREKVQAMTLDFVWLDEEPDEEYYTEALTRTNVASGPVYMTFTPLKGMSKTVARFLLEGHGHVTTMTIDDVDHYTPEQRAAIIAQYPAHEREARTKGVPALGSGRIFPLAEEQIKIEPFPIPAHWPRLAAIDFGWNHPAGVVWVAWDRDADIVYVYDGYRAKETLIPVHASAIKGRGQWIPCSWPHDGYQVKDAMHGEQLAQQYRAEGVNMRVEHAMFPESPIVGERKMSRMSTEAGIQEMLTRMESGRLKVFSHLADWFEEFRMYHRKDGLIVKLRDDLMSATRLTIMDLRHAETEPSKSQMIDHDRRSDGYI